MMREMMRSNLKIRETGRRKIGEARQEGGKEEMERGEREKKEEIGAYIRQE